MSSDYTKIELELAQAKKRIAELESIHKARCGALLSSLDISLCNWKPDTTLTFANQKYCQIFGIQSDPVGRCWLDYVPKEQHASTLQYIANLVQHPHPTAAVAENPARMEDGSIQYYQWVVTPVLDERGEVVEFQSLGVDITARKQAEQQVQALQELSQATTDALSAHICVLDERGVIISVNQAWRDFADANPPAPPQYCVGSSYIEVCENATGKEQDIAWGAAQGLREVLNGQRAEYVLEYFCSVSSDARWFLMKARRFQVGRAAYMVISHEDITARKLTEESLRQNEMRLRRAQSTGRIGDWEIDMSAGKLFYSDEMFKLLERDPALGAPEIIDAMNYLSPEDSARMQEMILNAMQTGQGWENDVFVRLPSGKEVWHHEIGTITRDSEGNILKVSGVAQDVTERKKVEQELRESNERFRQITESIQEVFWMFDNRRERIIYISPAYEKIWGRTAESLYQDGWQYIEAILPEDREIMFAALERQARGEPTEMEYRIQRPDGSIRWIYDRSFPVLDENGVVAHTTGIATDHTQHKESELALRASENRYRELSEELEERVKIRTAEVQDLYDHAPIGYHSLDGSGNFLLINQTHAQWLGLPPEEIVGRAFVEFLTPASEAAFVDLFPVFKARGSMRDIELDLRSRNGKIMPVLISATAIYNPQGEYVMSRTSVFDNTDQKEADEAMRHANRELARAMRMKDEFLASMSHELRTPLTGILGMAESLQYEVYGALNERQKRSLALIEDSGRHLLELINDILDVSKIEAGKLELEISTCSLYKICQAGLQLVRGMATNKRQNVQFSFTPTSIALRGDERRLKQVLVNLLSNAVKFTPEGGLLGLDVLADPASQSVSISVWDRGIGISAENLQRLFKPFIQLDSSLSRQNSGTGLGLVLAQRIIEVHSGSIRVESTAGQGSRFTVILPYLPEEEPPLEGESDEGGGIEALTSQTGSLASIMIVDDNQTNLDALSDYLQASHFKVSSALSGADFLARVSQNRPDVVLMDIQMPGMDGMETIRRLRAMPDPWLSRIPVIAVTALAMPGDREQCLAAGANEYISKPLRLRDLKGLVERVVGG